MDLKIKQNGKEYTYNYKNIIIKPELHQRIKLAAQDSGLSMHKFIEKLVNENATK